jgi:hypothetical protein
MPDQDSAGDPIAPQCEVIEVHVAELKQLFNEIDPSPFREKDLDGDAEEFIVGWAKDVPRKVPLALLVHADRPARSADSAAVLRDAIRQYFGHRAEVSRQRVRQLLRVGRTSLVVGIGALAVALVAGQLIGNALHGRVGELLRESFLIGGWVAMWRPMEIFLYDWWPIREDARLYDRLSRMPVRIAYAPGRKESG